MHRSAIESRLRIGFLVLAGCAFLLAVPSAIRAEVCNGLIGRWTFNEGAGLTAQDVAGVVDDDGALVAGPLWVAAGMSGSALGFDGVDDRVEVPLSADLTATAGLTLAAWVRVDLAAAGVEVLLNTYGADGYYLRLDLAASEIGFSGRGTLSAPYSIPRGVWFHVAGTYDATTATCAIYVNGTQIGSGQTCFPAPCAPAAPQVPLTIGSSSAGVAAFLGQMDEVRIYSRALSVAEIAELSLPASLSSGLVADWHLDEGAGATTSDVAGAVADGGTLVGGPVWSAGYRGMALTFDGVNDRVEVPLSADLTATAGLTLSAWINVAPGASGTDWVVSTYFGGGYYLRLDLDVPAIDFTAQGTFATPYPIPRGTWMHVAGTYDAATGMSTIFVNGSPIATGLACSPAPCPPATPVVPLTIGSFSGGTGSFQGQIDEVRMYNRALSYDEVADLATPTTLGIGLVAQWCLDEGAGATAYDIAVAIGDDGTLVGEPTWGAGYDGGGLTFDGINDRVEVPLSADLTTTDGLTLSAWINVAPGAGGTGWVVSTYFAEGYYLRLDLDQPAIEFDARGWLGVPYPIPRGEWIHVAGTYDAATALSTIYVNGSPIGSGTVCGPAPCAPAVPAVPLTIGSFSGGIEAFQGQIDEVSIHGRALAPSEIRGLAGNPSVVGIEPVRPAGGGTDAPSLAVFPNPSGALTTMAYDLPRSQRVRVSVRDIAGRRVRVVQDWIMQEPGSHTCRWDGRDDDGRVARSGLYYWNLEAGGRRFAKALVRIR